MSASKKSPRRKPLGALALTAVLVLSACSDQPQDPGGDQSPSQDAEPTRAEGDPVPGGVLRFGRTEAISCIDPHQFLDLSVISNVVDSLTDIHPDTNEIIPRLATGWTVNEDATEFTFTLRDNVTFSNGEKLDADVVKQNFDTILTLPSSQYAAYYLRDVEEITADSPTQLTVRFSAPRLSFLRSTAQVDLGIVAPETLATSEDERCQHIIGSGPFVVTAFAPDRGATLESREGYTWGSDRGSAIGPFLDTVEITVVPESATRLGALTSGELHVIDQVQPNDESFLNDAGYEVRASEVQGIVWNLSANVGRAPFDDVRVRRAAQLAVNLDEIEQAALTGSWQRKAKSVLAESTPEFVDESEHLLFDPTAAERLLDEAGWARDGTGPRTKDGATLTIDIPFHREDDVILLVQQQLNAVGFDTKIRKVARAERTEVIANFDFDLVWWAANNEGVSALTSTLSPNYLNRLGASPGQLPSFEQTLDELAAAATEEERTTAVRTATQEIYDEAYLIPVFPWSEPFGVDPTLQGLRLGDVYYNPAIDFRDTWLSE